MKLDKLPPHPCFSQVFNPSPFTLTLNLLPMPNLFLDISKAMRGMILV